MLYHYRAAVLCLSVLATSLGLVIQSQAEDFGAFLDQLNVQMLDDGRKLKLLNDYRYRDPRDEIWIAPNGWTVDGASIPQTFWSRIGGPLEGQYRNASVIHDYYCDSKKKTWQETHLNFYYGMRAAGVGEVKAEVMYYAVYKYGPRWKPVSRQLCQTLSGHTVCDIVSTVMHVAPPATQADLREVENLQRELEANGPIGADRIRDRASATMLERFPAQLQ